MRLVPRLVLPLLALVLGHPAAAQAASTCPTPALSVSPLQTSVFYVDSSSGIDYLGSYVGYRVTNDGATARDGLWVRLEAFAGGVVRPADGGAATAPVPLSAIAAGGATPAYAYLKASGATTAAQDHDVVVYDGRPGAGGVELCRAPQRITAVADVIKAAANKVDGASVSTTSAALGGTFELTVTGHTGTIGSGPANDPGVVRFSPAVAADWPSSAFRLTGVSHRLPVSFAAVPDVLSRSGLGGTADTPYSVTYTFRVVGPTSAPTPLVPVQNIASGTQVKHTDPGTLADLAPIPVVVNNTTVEVTIGGSSPYDPGERVPVTAKITNAGSGDVALDELVITMPPSWGYAAGSSARDGAPVEDPHDDGTDLHFVGPFTVAGGATSTFTLDVLAGDAGSTGTVGGYGVLEGARIDASTSTTDDAASAEPVTVVGPPTAADDAASTATGGSRLIDVLANDELTGAAGTLSIVTPPASGTAVVEDGQVRYTAPAATGTDTFTYRVDTAGGHSTATVTVTVAAPPAPPAPGDLTSTGAGTTPQTAAATVPAGGRAALVLGDGSLATTASRDGVGTFEVDAATGELTFRPVLGYTGTPAPAVFELTDEFGQTGRASYTPTVTAPAPPAAGALTTTGAGPLVQSHALPVPDGGSATLLDGGTPVAELAVDGQGTYRLDGGRVAFTPLAGFTGTATPAGYRVTDAYAQSAASTYTPTVALPPAPVAGAEASTGVGTQEQVVALTVPDAGSVTLLSGLGQPAASVTVPGEGTYVLDPVTAEVAFTPVLGFSGTASGVGYRVTDAYGRTADGTCTPAVTKPAAPSAPAESSTGVGVAPQSAALAVPAGAEAVLLGADGRPAAEVVVPGQGTYVLEAGTIVFRPVLGFAGTPSPVPYRVTDAYGQAATGTYAPRVTLPPAPEGGTQQTTGAPAQPQSQAIEVPAGGRATLLDAEGRPAARVVVPGAGAYVLAEDGGSITFVPEPGFSGRPSPVRYRVTDAYGQDADRTYQAEVEPAPAAVAAPEAPAPPAAPARCASLRTMTVNFKVARGTRLRSVVVTVAGRRTARLRGSARRTTVDLRGRGARRTVVRITATTTRGRVLTTTRTYNPCADRRLAPTLRTLVLKPVRRRS